MNFRREFGRLFRVAVAVGAFGISGSALVSCTSGSKSASSDAPAKSSSVASPEADGSNGSAESTLASSKTIPVKKVNPTEPVETTVADSRPLSVLQPPKDGSVPKVTVPAAAGGLPLPDGTLVDSRSSPVESTMAVELTYVVTNAQSALTDLKAKVTKAGYEITFDDTKSGKVGSAFFATKPNIAYSVSIAPGVDAPGGKLIINFSNLP